MTAPDHWLTDGGMTLTVQRRTPAGILTATYDRDPAAGPFTSADVAYVLSAQPAVTRAMQPGQVNRTRRFTTRAGGTWFLHVMTGPPTWWRPRLTLEKNGALVAGWLRAAVAVKYDPNPNGDPHAEHLPA